jgi:hypothetical protein
MAVVGRPLGELVGGPGYNRDDVAPVTARPSEVRPIAATRPILAYTARPGGRTGRRSTRTAVRK